MSHTFNNRGLRFAGGPRTASKKLSHIKRAAATRRVLPGFPIETKFLCPEDVWEYLNADFITCLRCGKPYKSLGVHLRVHGWDETRYRKFYGLPWRTGLTAASTKEKKRTNGKSNYRKGLCLGLGMARDKAREAPRRDRADYLKAVCIRNVTTRLVNADDLARWKSSDYWRLLDRMKEEDKPASEVCGDADMPKSTALHMFARMNPDFSRALSLCHESLSFAAQARAQRLGARFRAEASALRRTGLTSDEIAARLGVSRLTVVKHIAGVPRPKKTHCPQGHPYPHDGPKICKICALESSRRSKGHLPRGEAAKVQITVKCFICERPVKRSRLRGANRRARCKSCWRLYHKEYEATRREKTRAAP